MFLAEESEKSRRRFERLADSICEWKEKNWYYYDQMYRYLRFLIPENKRVLMLGSGTGDLLAALKPSQGLGIDISPRMVALAQARHPELRFQVGDVDKIEGVEEVFDFVVMTDVLGHLQDIEEALRGLRRFCHKSTRLVICYFNFLWEPVVRLGQRIGRAMPQGLTNWLSGADIRDILHIGDYEIVKEERRLLMPVRVPFVSRFVNRYLAALPGVRRLCLLEFFVARPKQRADKNDYSISIVIPCKNERGNVENAVKRLPEIARKQEIIFVEGHSSDGTRAEIERVISAYPEKSIKLVVQTGRGKGDAVRAGFAEATGDMLIILDGDLTVPPEDLPKFYRALATDKGEFVNGSRLVYPMEKQAMRLLNILGNKFFSMAFTWLLNQRFKDTLCGTKGLLRKDYERIKENREYFGDFDPFGDFDLIFGAAKLNLKIIEIPVRYRERVYGSTQISRFRHGYQLLRMSVFAFRKLKAF